MSNKNYQIWKMDDHLLICGDSTNKALVEKVLRSTYINSVITDPPYACAVVESSLNTTKHKKILNDHIQSDKEYISFTKKWLNPVKTFISDINTYYVFNSDKKIFALHQALIESGFRFGQLLIWIKNHAVIGRLDYLPMHELIAYGWIGKHKFFKSKDKSVLFYPKPQKSRFHPTTKPISLIRHLILNSTMPEHVVYDPFLGSGTTLLACEQTKRKCIGFEIEEKYCQIIIKRWEKLTGKKSIKLEMK